MYILSSNLTVEVSLPTARTVLANSQPIYRCPVIQLLLHAMHRRCMKCNFIFIVYIVNVKAGIKLMAYNASLKCELCYSIQCQVSLI